MFFRYSIFLDVIPFLVVGLIGCSNNIDKDQNLDQKLSTTSNQIEAVAALGYLSPKGNVRRLAPPSSGVGGTPRVLEILVVEGENISKGQVLAVFDNRLKLESDLNMAKANLSKLDSQITIKMKEIDRYIKASREGAVALSFVDQKEQELTQLKGEKSETFHEIEGLKSDLTQSFLISPIDGVVLKIVSRKGERPGVDGVIEVGANDYMEALIEVYESDIERVKVGQNVSIISENGGFKGTLKGEVSLVSPQVRQRKVLSTDPTGDADARIVEVRVKLDNYSANLVRKLSGMKVIAKFLIP